MAKQKINSYQNGGFWEELGRVSGSSAVTTTAAVTISPRKYLKLIFIGQQATSTATAPGFQFNSDTGASQYGRRTSSFNGTSVSSNNTDTNRIIFGESTSADDLVGGEVFIIGKDVFGSQPNIGSMLGFGSQATRMGSVWWKGSADITSVAVVEGTTNNLKNYELIVLGHD